MNLLSFVFTLFLVSCGNGFAKSFVYNTDDKDTVVANNDVETVNLMNYGAKGLGVASVKEDTTALHKAIAYLNSKGGGKLYVPNPPNFYAFAGDGVFVGDNIEIYGDGKGKSEIKNVSPTSGRFLRGPIFLFSTYGANNKTNIFQDGIDQYAFKDAKEGESSVTLKDQSKQNNMFVGEVVAICSHKFLHGGYETKARFHFMELNEITSMQNGVVKFKYPFTTLFTTDAQGNPPVIVNINNTSSKNFQLGIKNGTSKNIYIHDLTLSQSQTDEITGEALGDDENLPNGLSSIWQPGGAFNSRFENIEINAYEALGGNMFTRCNFNNIDIHASRKLMDFGYGASNDTIYNINWVFEKSPASNFASSFIICNDGTHNILMHHITASGDWNGESIVLLSQAKNITLHDMKFTFPSYRKDNASVQISDYEGAYSDEIRLYNIEITINEAKCFLRVVGNKAQTNVKRNIQLHDIVFNGNITNDSRSLANSSELTSPKKAEKKAAKMSNNKNQEDKNAGIYVKDISGLNLENIKISTGQLYFENCTNANIRKITAVSSYLMVKGSQANTKFEELKVANR